MDKQQLLKALNLDENANADALKQAYEAKLGEIDGKIEQAPTDALKQKFAQIKADLAGAYASAMVASVQAASPLSQTQVADLPQSDMSYTGFEAGGQEAGAMLGRQLKPGTELSDGRYQIKEQVGAGGMGAVFRAFDKNRDEDIAIKVLLPQLTKHERARERFLNEARLSSKLSHPNIVNVFDVQNDGDLYYLTMELLEGQDLRQVMENQKLARQQFEVEEVKEIVAAVSEGLGHAHEVTVHRDIKPENIWMGDDGKIKLMDFGIAQLQSTTQRTKTNAAMGTAYYMAPEQLKGRSDIDGRADQYAVAVLAYELLTGEVPAGAIEPVQDLRGDTPKGMALGIMQALSPRAENRFASISAFNQALQSGKGKAAPKRASQAGSNGLKNFVKVGLPLVVLMITGFVFWQYYAQQQEYKDMIAFFKTEIKDIKGELAQKREDLMLQYSDAEANKGDVAYYEQLLAMADNQVFTGNSAHEERAKVGELERNWQVAALNYETAFDDYAGRLKTYANLGDKVLAKIVMPTMVKIPSGSFNMGSNDGEEEEKPEHTVRISSFKLGKTEITWNQYQPCIDAGVCPNNKSAGGDENWGKGTRPVINVSWNDTQTYIRWLNQLTIKRYRLPTEAEWEYAARAGSSSKYSWGNSIGNNRANCNGCGSQWDKKKTAPVASFSPNAWGLYDMHGNVQEWVQDCWNSSYSGAPSNGVAWRSGNCRNGVLRGGGWVTAPWHLRSAKRNIFAASIRYAVNGFRLAQD